MDELFEEAAKLVIREGKGSASLIQRRLEVGYARAARILDELEDVGVLGPTEGNAPRPVLISSIEDIKDEDKMRAIRYANLLEQESKYRWEPMDLRDHPLGAFQKEYKGSKDVYFPLGYDAKRNLTLAPLTATGHAFVFYSPLSQASSLVSNAISGLINTYSPEVLRYIVFDETSGLSNSLFREQENLLTPVINKLYKLENALKWTANEMERRFAIFSEMNMQKYEEYLDFAKDQFVIPRILLIINNPSGSVAHNEVVMSNIEKILSAGQIAGINTIIVAPLLERKFSKLMMSVPTKVVFKTFSTIQADLLGTDDAFDLKSPNEFLYIPAYGKVEKLRV